MAEQISCRVCGGIARRRFVAQVLRKYDVAYYECLSCFCVQTETPYWLGEAYASSINAEDTGLLARNTAFADRLSPLLFSLVGPQGKFLDYAGGYGVFTRMMRDRGFDFYWTDKFTQNLMAQGFEYRPGSKVDALTIFEAFEHFVEPANELENLLSIADIVVFSTELIADETPAPDAWWYYGHQHGQHVCFYRQQTLAALAKRFGLRWYSNNQNLHLFSKRALTPYCMPEKYFSAIDRCTNGRLASVYASTSDRIRHRSSPNWLRDEIDMRRGERFRLIKTTSDEPVAAASEGLADCPALDAYLMHLLTGDTRRWQRLLKTHLESKTFSDMQAVIAASAALG
jgi:hypothetical protein